MDKEDRVVIAILLAILFLAACAATKYVIDTVGIQDCWLGVITIWLCTGGLFIAGATKD